VTTAMDGSIVCTILESPGQFTISWLKGRPNSRTGSATIAQVCTGPFTQCRVRDFDGVENLSTGERPEVQV